MPSDSAFVDHIAELQTAMRDKRAESAGVHQHHGPDRVLGEVSRAVRQLASGSRVDSISVGFLVNIQSRRPGRKEPTVLKGDEDDYQQNLNPERAGSAERDHRWHEQGNRE